MRASARRGAVHARVAHRTVYRTCPVRHRTARRAHKTELQRSEPSGLVTWLAHRTVSGAPPDSVRCTRGLHAELLTFGKIQRRSVIIHRTVRCPRGERLWNSPASGIRSAIIHRTCPVCTGLSDEPAEQRLFGANGHLLQH
jgi:hypothetical protein